MTARQCRVVVTGLGLVSPLGTRIPSIWSSLISGGSGIVRIPTDFQSRRADVWEKLPSKIAGLIPRGDRENELNLNEFSTSQRRQMSMSTLFALRACNDALKDAGFKDDLKENLSDSEKEQIGVAVGVGMIDLEEVAEVGSGLYSKGYSAVGPYFIPRILPNMAAGHIAIANGLRGPNHCVSTACATGAYAIGDAFTMIKRRQASVMICGGSEASVSPLGIAGFCRLRALSTRFNDKPVEASRPFDRDRDGFVIGEGAGIVILEEYEHAVKRGAPMIYAEVLGYGLSGDGFHITSPDKEGRGAYLCMKRAVDDAGLKPSDIGYVNAHATSTPLGDEVEASAIARLFDQIGNDCYAVSSTKGATGHLLGAAGAAEFIFTVLAIHHGILPPTLNLHQPAVDLRINFVPLTSQSWPANGGKRRIALTNSFGFGGTNILCLHGYRQNGEIFRQKTGGLRKILSKVAEFHFLTAPHVANVDTDVNGQKEEESDGPGRDPRGWWFSRPNNQFSSKDYTDLSDGFQETVDLVDQAFKEKGPFDGIIGFSQGACLAALICALKDRGDFKHNFRFVVLFAGFQSRCSLHRHLTEARLSVNSLHVIGKSDAVITEEMAKSLFGQYINGQILEHTQGHMVPSATSLAREVLKFLEQFQDGDTVAK